METLINAGITLNHFLVLTLFLFMIGMCGVFINRKSVISILLSIELMLLASSINFVAFSTYIQNIVGQVFVMFILAVAAAEASIGLAILIVYFKLNDTIEIENISTMKE